ncbi:MAG: hypothetical protein ACRDIC_12375 [bacterium]
MRIALLLIAAIALLPACGGDDIGGPDGGDDIPDPDGGDDNPAPDGPPFLAFTVQPALTTAGQVMRPAVQVSVKDAAGKLLTSNTAAITVSLNRSGATLNGQRTRTATNGVAVFSDFSITKADTHYFLTATAPDVSDATSTEFLVQPGPASAIAIHDGDAQVVERGGTVPQPPSVRVTDEFGNPVRNVSVAFEVASGGGTVEGAQARTGADGVAAVTRWRLGDSPGPNTLRATVGTLTGSPVTFTATAVNVGVAASGVVAFTARQQNLALINPDGTNPRTLTMSTPGQNDLGAAWSPDGTRIAFTRMADNTSFPLAIHIISPNGTNLVRLSPAGALDDTPAWSPDGRRIAFTNQDIQDPSPVGTQVWVMNADGTNRVRLTALPQGAGWPAWSRDGKIAFATGTSVNNGDIYAMDADGSDIAILTNDVGRESDPKWSPDGRHIVYSANQPNSALFVIDADGANRRQLTSPPLEQWSYSDFGPAWSPDGKWIVFNRRYDCDRFQESGGPACVPDELRVTSSSGDGVLSSFLTRGRSASWGP